MIRMGRGNRTDDETTPGLQERVSAPPISSYSPQQATHNPTTSAVSESDAMARDIKEGRLSGFVGHGTTLTGETDFHAMLRVDGHLVGSVSSEAGTLIIGTNGQVDANIMVAAAMINGTVNGDIVASEKLQLGRTARVMGNIQSPRLIIEEGAILEGSCSMLKARETQEEEAVAAAGGYNDPADTNDGESDAATIEKIATASIYMTNEDEDDDEDDEDEDDEDESAEAASA